VWQRRPGASENELVVVRTRSFHTKKKEHKRFQGQIQDCSLQTRTELLAGDHIAIANKAPFLPSPHVPLIITQSLTPI